MKIKIFCDSADIKTIKRFNSSKIVKGFTTNPSLMRKAGAKNSALFAIAILSRKYPAISLKLKKYRSEFESNIPKRPH